MPRRSPKMLDETRTDVRRSRGAHRRSGLGDQRLPHHAGQRSARSPRSVLSERRICTDVKRRARMTMLPSQVAQQLPAGRRRAAAASCSTGELHEKRLVPLPARGGERRTTRAPRARANVAEVQDERGSVASRQWATTAHIPRFRARRRIALDTHRPVMAIRCKQLLASAGLIERPFRTKTSSSTLIR